MCVARCRSTADSARRGVKPGISTTVAPAAIQVGDTIMLPWYSGQQPTMTMSSVGRAVTSRRTRSPVAGTCSPPPSGLRDLTRDAAHDPAPPTVGPVT